MIFTGGNIFFCKIGDEKEECFLLFNPIRARNDLNLLRPQAFPSFPELLAQKWADIKALAIFFLLQFETQIRCLSHLVPEI